MEDGKIASQVAREAFAELTRRGFHPDAFSVNRMLIALLRAGAFDEAKRQVLEAHQHLLDKHSWTIYGKFLVEANRADEAIDVYRSFRKDASAFANLKPDVAFFNVYLSACAKNAKLEIAKKIRRDMEQRQVWPDQITHHCMMQTFAAAGQLDAAEEELQAMEENEKTYGTVQVTSRTYNTLIDASTKAADFKRAKRLLSAMQAKNLEADVFTFNILINGAANMGQHKKAPLVDLFFYVVYNILYIYTQKIFPPYPYMLILVWSTASRPSCFISCLNSIGSVRWLRLRNQKENKIEDMVEKRMERSDSFISREMQKNNLETSWQRRREDNFTVNNLAASRRS